MAQITESDNLYNSEEETEERLYKVVKKVNEQTKIIKGDLQEIKQLSDKGLSLYNIYDLESTTVIPFDIDDAKDLNEVKEYLTIFNEIVNDEFIKSQYKEINKTFKIYMLAYGSYNESDINDIKKGLDNYTKNFHIHYEHINKDVSNKDFSAHVFIICPVKYIYIYEAIGAGKKAKLTTKDKSISKKIDKSIYGKHHLLRLMSTDKNINGLKKVALKLNEKEFKRQFVQYIDPISLDEEIKYNLVFQHIIKTYFDITSNTDNKKVNNENITNEENIKELPTQEKEEFDQTELCTAVPLGLIADILSHYPVVPYDEFICVPEDLAWSCFSGFVLACPYKYEDIKDILYNYYNNGVKRNTPDALNDYVEKNIKYSNTSQHFFSLIKYFKNYMTFDEFIVDKAKKGNFDYNTYIKYKNKGPKKLKLEELEEYNQLTKQYNKIKIEYQQQYNKTNDLYKKYLKIFKTYQIFTQKRTTEDLSQNDYYIDVNTHKIMLKAYNEYDISFNQISQAEFKSAYDIDLKKVIKTNEDIYKKLLYTYTYTTETNYKNADRMLEIFKEGFKHETDYIIFLDFIREKLNNPSYMYPINFANYGGKDSLKTTFINIIKKYHDVSILNPNKIISTFNTEFLSSIVMIDELPIRVQDNQKAIENIKIHTLGDSFEVEAKGKDKKCVKNRSNIVINTNHKEIGGLFDYQEDGEMFKRFYVIEKQTITKQHINEFIKLMKDEANTKALIERIKTLTPLTDEQRDNRETQQEYYNFVKNNKNKRNVLTLSKIDDTIRTDKDGKKWLRIRELINNLKYENIITSAQTERQLLEKEDIITCYDGKKCRIKDLDKYYETYYLIECDDDTEVLNEHLKKLKEKEQQDNKESEPFEAI